MPIHVPQWFVPQLIAALAVDFLLIADLNVILASVSPLLLTIIVETVCGNLVIARGACIQAEVT
jgi:hypothetical protein